MGAVAGPAIHCFIAHDSVEEKGRRQLPGAILGMEYGARASPAVGEQQQAQAMG